jgi:hypothetical protein
VGPGGGKLDRSRTTGLVSHAPHENVTGASGNASKKSKIFCFNFRENSLQSPISR